MQLLLQYTWVTTSWFLKGEDLQKPTSWSGCTGNELCALLERGEYTGDIQIKRSLVKQKCLNMHAFDGIASMSSKLKLLTFSYLKLRVVACNVGVVVPGGRLGEEKNLLCSAVVYREEQLCLFQSVWIVSWLPFFSQRLRRCQPLQQHEDCPQKPVHSRSRGWLPQEERRERLQTEGVHS